MKSGFWQEKSRISRFEKTENFNNLKNLYNPENIDRVAIPCDNGGKHQEPGFLVGESRIGVSTLKKNLTIPESPDDPENQVMLGLVGFWFG